MFPSYSNNQNYGRKTQNLCNRVVTDLSDPDPVDLDDVPGSIRVIPAVNEGGGRGREGWNGGWKTFFFFSLLFFAPLGWREINSEMVINFFPFFVLFNIKPYLLYWKLQRLLSNDTWLSQSTHKRFPYKIPLLVCRPFFSPPHQWFDPLAPELPAREKSHWIKKSCLSAGSWFVWNCSVILTATPFLTYADTPTTLV